MPQLSIRKGTNHCRTYLFSDASVLLVGRLRSNSIWLPDTSGRVSRCHAALVRVSRTDESYMIRDLGSLRGTSVGGLAIQQHVLRDGDVIEIADYELLYTAHVPEQTEISPLRILAQKADPAAWERPTAFLPRRDAVQEIPWTAAQEELLEAALQQSRKGFGGSRFVAQMLDPLANVCDARRGFAALFRAAPDGDFTVPARFRMASGEQIEIAEADFRERLCEGRPVVEERTLLAPIVEQEQTVGFVALERGSAAPVFNAADVSFVMAFCRAAADRDSTTRSRRLKSARSEALEWAVELVGNSGEMDDIRQQIRDAVATEANLLLWGESGTGKELVARAYHEASRHFAGPFVARNCAAIPDGLAEVEVFGHAPKSGIAGADPAGAPGWFELAGGGVLFLDEIHALSLPLQDLFLRVLQEKQVLRVRGAQTLPVSCLIVAATDHDLDDAVAAGRFRKPLLYRFGKRIRIPALRLRPADIPLLAFYFLDRYAHRTGSPVRSLSRRALAGLLERAWPGNVRELENCMRIAVAKAAGREILFSWDFPEPAASHVEDAPAPKASVPVMPQTMEDVERAKILETLEATQGNISRAARLLGYRSRQTMLNKMDRFQIPRQYGDLDAA